MNLQTYCVNNLVQVINRMNSEFEDPCLVKKVYVNVKLGTISTFCMLLDGRPW